MKNRGLGRGLSSLLGEDIVVQSNNDNNVMLIELRSLEAGKYQPRKHFEQESLHDLATSIRQHGIMQPIIVHKQDNGRYAIVAGERRFRAAQIAGLSSVPAIIKELSPEAVLELALVENIQRENLNAMEEAEGYARLMDDFGYTQEKIAQLIGKSRSHIANLLRLNHLPDAIKDHVSRNILTMGHARLLVGNPMSKDLADLMIEKGLSVRQAEGLVKQWSNRDKTQRERRSPDYNSAADEEMRGLMDMLTEKFGMKISIESNSDGSKLIFHYNSLEQLDLILSKLN